MEVKYDLFTKVSDRRDIVDFVKEIEKYPCLYNKTLPEYANKVHNRRAWSTIAKKINTTVPDCRDKWRKIRISFMRSLKQQQSDKPPMRPYYLSEELQFLRPFLKVNPRAPIQKEIINVPMDYELPVLHKQEISDSDSSDPSELEIVEDEPEIGRVTFKDTDDITDEPEIGRVTFKDTDDITKEKPKDIVYVKHQPRNSYGEEKQNGRNSYSDDIEDNPRKMFLLSLVPDVECFTESEMRTFRREVINVCDNIMNKRMI